MKLMLGIVEIAQLLGIGKRSAYELVARPDFPRGRQLSPRLRRWLCTEVEAWCHRQPGGNGGEPTHLRRARSKTQL